jgi:hypothetical protein
LPSGPKRIVPPLWIVKSGSSGSSSRMTTSLAGLIVSPAATKRLMRLTNPPPGMMRV